MHIVSNIFFFSLVIAVVCGIIIAARRIASAPRPAKGLPMPGRVFAIIVVLMFIAFVTGGRLATILWIKIAPYWVFGLAETARLGLVVTGGDWRHTIIFSNGVTIHGLKLFPLLMIGMVLDFIFIISVWVLLVRTTIWLMKKLNPPLGDEILDGWHTLWNTRRPS